MNSVSSISPAKAKIILLTFGTIMGLLSVLTLKWFLSTPQEGLEFENIDEFRAALKDPRGNGKYRRPDGSLPFAAVIESNPNDEIIYTLRPHLNDNFTGALVQTNSQGMRSPERPKEKPEGTYRLALLGDSFAFGWGVEQKDGFAQVIEDTLNEQFKGNPRVEVLNFGVPGYSTFQEVAQFFESGMDFHPDGVLVFFVENDFDFPFFIRDKSSANGLIQSFSLGRAGKSNHPLLQQQKQAMKGRDPLSSLRRLDSKLKPLGIETFLAVNPRKDWRGILKQLSPLRNQTTIHFVDFGEQFEADVAAEGYTDSDLNLPNDPHPTALRHRMYGKLIAEDLELFIQR